jgi:hypothetical protein
MKRWVLTRSNSSPREEQRDKHENSKKARRLSQHRVFLYRVTAIGIILSTLIAVLIPNRYTSTVQLMPPDHEIGTGAAMMSALPAKVPGFGLGAELLGFEN